MVVVSSLKAFGANHYLKWLKDEFEGEAKTSLKKCILIFEILAVHVKDTTNLPYESILTFFNGDQ